MHFPSPGHHQQRVTDHHDSHPDGAMDDREILELRQLCTAGGLTQDSLGALMDAELSVPALVRNEAAAMANAKKAGLGLQERNKLRDALRRHKDNVLSSADPQIVELDDDAEVRARDCARLLLLLPSTRTLARLLH